RVGAMARAPSKFRQQDVTRAVALREPTMHFIEANHVKTRPREPAHHTFEKSRSHFQEPVGLKPVEARRPHVMKREDCPDTADEGSHDVMRGTEIERLEAAADDCFLQLAQGCNPKMGGPRLSQLFIDNCLPLSRYGGMFAGNPIGLNAAGAPRERLGLWH